MQELIPPWSQATVVETEEVGDRAESVATGLDEFVAQHFLMKIDLIVPTPVRVESSPLVG
jgi:hypothetical protein